VKSAKYIPLFFIFLLLGCERDEQKRIPDFTVYLELNLLGEYATFRNPLDTVVYDKRIKELDRNGFGGVLVNIGYDGKYYAYDLACPYEVNPKIRVFPDESGMKAICRECGSEFDIWNGTGMVSKSPSKWNLKRYRTDLIRNSLFISNY
jgi:nitrite reductase/ring-hydroxylating ferredoxin subunit